MNKWVRTKYHLVFTAKKDQKVFLATCSAGRYKKGDISVNFHDFGFVLKPTLPNYGGFWHGGSFIICYIRFSMFSLVWAIQVKYTFSIGVSCKAPVPSARQGTNSTSQLRLRSVVTLRALATVSRYWRHHNKGFAINYVYVPATFNASN